MIDAICQICEKSFTAKIARAKYCSGECRQRSKYLPGGCYFRNPISCASCGKATARFPKAIEGKTRCVECRAESAARPRKNPSVTEWTCESCGAHCTRPPTKGQTPKYCSTDCASIKQMRPKRCAHCGDSFKTTTSATMHCEDCFKRQVWKSFDAQWKQCEWCLTLHNLKFKHCSRECRSRAAEAHALSQRSPLRVALENRDHTAVIEIIRADATINSKGCWIWPKKMKGGYPFANIAGTSVAIHRIVLEAKHGKPLGSQAAHHTCSVRACVNPEHLQPVTHQENTAEMLQRRAYRDRIAELEQALSELAPDHPLLTVIKVA